MSRSRVRQFKSHIFNVNLVIVHNLIIKNSHAFIKNNLAILYSDPEMKNTFPEGTISATYKRGKSLKGFISPLLFSQAWV